MRRFSGNMDFLHRFVRKRQLSDDVANRENVRYVGAHLLFYADESTPGYGYADFADSDFVADRIVPDRKKSLFHLC